MSNFPSWGLKRLQVPIYKIYFRLNWSFIKKSVILLSNDKVFHLSAILLFKEISFTEHVFECFKDLFLLIFIDNIKVLCSWNLRYFLYSLRKKRKKSLRSLNFFLVLFGIFFVISNQIINQNFIQAIAEEFIEKILLCCWNYFRKFLASKEAVWRDLHVRVHKV